jgi:hypothetical protein
MDNKAEDIFSNMQLTRGVGLWSLWKGLRSEHFVNELCYGVIHSPGVSSACAVSPGSRLPQLL